MTLLCDFAEALLVLTTDIGRYSAGTVLVGPLQGFTGLQLVQYGHKRRAELVEKWYNLDPVVASDQVALARKVVSVKRMADTAIGKNFVPSYPLFILAMLQIREIGQQANIDASTYGYFYEILIRQALATGSSAVASIDIKASYLSFLAYRCFVNKKKESSESELMELHKEFEEVNLLDVNFGNIVRDLVECRVLFARQSHYGFLYSYIYYYFVALYLRDHITESDIQDLITEVCQALSDDENGNVLLFLVHLSKHPFILTQLKLVAASQFHEVEAAILNPGTLDHLLHTDFKSSAMFQFVDGDPKKNRQRLLEEADLEERKARPRVEKPTQNMGKVNENDGDVRQEDMVRAANKALKIIGQVVKNFPGSIPGDAKLILVEECYGIGLRLLASLLAFMESKADEIVGDLLVKRTEESDPYLSPEAFSRKARRTLFAIAVIGSAMTIKKISAAVGAAELARVYEQKRTVGNAARELIYISLKLDQFSPFPEREIDGFTEEFQDNAFAMQTLRGMVMAHFHVFEESYDLKQRVCQRLGIPYKRSAGRRALVSRTRRGKS